MNCVTCGAKLIPVCEGSSGLYCLVCQPLSPAAAPALACECGHEVKYHEGFTLSSQKEPGCSFQFEDEKFCTCNEWKPSPVTAMPQDELIRALELCLEFVPKWKVMVREKAKEALSRAKSARGQKP